MTASARPSDNQPPSPEGIPTGTRAMLFAAGLGTRLKPFTDHHPKALAPVNGKPLLQRNIEYLRQAGICDILVNLHHCADQISDFLQAHEDFGARITLSVEQPVPLETGGGLLKAAWFFTEAGGPFIVMNADILTNLNLPAMYRWHLAHQAMATLAVTRRESSRQLLFDAEMRLSGWQHVKTGETRMARPEASASQPFAFSGVHIIEPKLLQSIRQSGVFSIIDSYLDLASALDIRGYLHEGDAVVDVGRPESIQEAERWFH
ncbi:MAG: nucleotidyltransferase family protein [Bacteroidetes bacterium]|nr:nucleotidyltransferase family protein [Bacteroidota bacterium]